VFFKKDLEIGAVKSIKPGNSNNEKIIAKN
jgi:hypothetical protein